MLMEGMIRILLNHIFQKASLLFQRGTFHGLTYNSYIVFMIFRTKI